MLECNSQNPFFVFFQDPPKKIFFAGLRSASEPRLVEITCMTGRRESYRVILVERGRAAEGRPKKIFWGYPWIFSVICENTYFIFDTQIFIKFSEHFSKFQKF
jgi:hypothetical protein